MAPVESAAQTKAASDDGARHSNFLPQVDDPCKWVVHFCHVPKSGAELVMERGLR